MPYSRTTYDDVAADAAADRRRFDEPPYDIQNRYGRPGYVAAQLAEDWRHDAGTGQFDDGPDDSWWDDRTDDWWVSAPDEDRTYGIENAL